MSQLKSRRLRVSLDGESQEQRLGYESRETSFAARLSKRQKKSFTQVPGSRGDQGRSLSKSCTPKNGYPSRHKRDRRCGIDSGAERWLSHCAVKQTNGSRKSPWLRYSGINHYHHDGSAGIHFQRVQVAVDRRGSAVSSCSTP